MGISLKKSKFSWANYWAGKKNGAHRFSTEEFLSKEAREKLFHLDGGESILDFGCGSADLLVHYIPHYTKVVGVDFSDSMLSEAKKKITETKHENVCLILADDKTVWDKLDSSFDRISASQVIQFLTFEQIDNFIRNASDYLNDGGKIIFFDMVDPRLSIFFKTGLFSRRFRYWKIIPGMCIEAYNQILNILEYKPKGIVGYSHNPYKIEELARKHGFGMEYVQSMYYEYRYHAILFRIT